MWWSVVRREEVLSGLYGVAIRWLAVQREGSPGRLGARLAR